MRKPKILVWDLETAGPNSFKADLAAIICFGYKFVGEKTTHVLTIDQFPKWFKQGEGLNDKGLIEAALRIMGEADILVAHFGDIFDRRFFQGRCAIHGFTPPPPTKQRDTWRIARTAFNFSSNRLEALVDTLNLPFKKYHKKHPGEWPGWWLRALAGDKKAIHAMSKYCKQDVDALEGLYLAIRQYDYNHPRLVEDRTKCGICGGDIQYRGTASVGENKYRRFVCSQCGKWGRETGRVKE